MAVPVDLGSGKRGIDLTYTIRPDAVWGDGMPVTTDDVLFAYEVGRNPQSAVGNAEMYRHITGISVKDDKTFTIHDNRFEFAYAAIDDFVPLPPISNAAQRWLPKTAISCAPRAAWAPARHISSYGTSCPTCWDR